MSPFETLAQLITFSLFSGPPPGLPVPSSTGARVPPSASISPSAHYLFDESRRQAVTALTYDALLKLPKEQRPPRSVLFHFLSMTQTIEGDNRRREETLLAFHNEVLQPLGIPTVVVKGSAIASLYPQPLHRECGDNDLYTGTQASSPANNTHRLANHLESIGIPVDRKDPRHISFTFHDVDFEAHNYLLYHHDDPLWKTHPTTLHPTLYTLHPSHQAFFLAKHIEHHAVFFHNPVRLRDFVDWVMLLRSPDFDLAELRQLKSGTDVDIFAELMTLYCNKIFNLDLPCRVPESLVSDDFHTIYIQCPERHPFALLRVARRAGKYLRYWRKYKAIYGESMFRRFYLHNLWVALWNSKLSKLSNLN
ncbi:MAG: nucleotidyltransferase family protein [Bacteroidales bacterium]|nr:nucleotidyltransferase family protein [Bacteroidales bacterium]